MVTAREKPIREGKKMRSYIVTGQNGTEYPYLAESTDHAMDQHEAEGYPVGCGVHETEERDITPFIDRYLLAEAKLSDYRAANGAPLRWTGKVRDRSVARCALAGPVTFEGIGTHTGYLIFASA